MIRLKSLTTAVTTPANECFGYPRHIVFENLPSLSTVILQRAFQYSDDIEMSNVFSSSYEKRVTVGSGDAWTSLDPTITHLTVSASTMNEVPLSRFIALKELMIGTGCLNSATTLEVIGMNRLERLEVGSNSFRRWMEARTICS